jgi:hypothetical protein
LTFHLMLSGDERDRTANLLVANQALSETNRLELGSGNLVRERVVELAQRGHVQAVDRGQPAPNDPFLDVNSGGAIFGEPLDEPRGPRARAMLHSDIRADLVGPLVRDRLRLQKGRQLGLDQIALSLARTNRCATFE